MRLQEFVFDKKKAEKALDRLNEARANNPNIYDDFNGPDCKCPYGDVSPEDCEDLCRLNHK